MKGRMNLPRSARIAGTALAVVLLLTSAAYAQAPSIHFDTIGETHYAASTKSIDIHACADFLFLGGAPGFITGTCGRNELAIYGTVTITGSVTNAGQLTNAALTVTGAIPDGGIPNGVLLTGTGIGLTSTNAPDELIFKFKVTGGMLQSQYTGFDLVVRVGLELSELASTFNGSFAVDFEGGAEGTIDGIAGGGGGGELPRCTVPGTVDTGGTGTIGDRVWNDANRNGIQDVDAAGLSTEAGIGAVPIDLYSWDETTAAWNHLLNTVTSDSGDYVFQNLCHGTFKVEAGTPDEFTASAPNRAAGAYDSNSNPSMVVLETDDSEDLTIDFGFYETPDGPFMTFTQAEWGSKPRGDNPGMLLKNNFAFVYPASLYPSGVVIGDATVACPATGAGPYKLTLTKLEAIQEFLPQSHPVRALVGCLKDPGKKVSFFAGQVLALTLNVAFSYAGVTKPGLGSLEVIRGPLAGLHLTVDGVLERANCMLSGKSAATCGVPGVTLKQMNKAVRQINRNFPGGTKHRKTLLLPASVLAMPTSIDPDDDGED